MLLIQENLTIQFFFAGYMFLVHLVLLNLLIAIMQHSYTRSIAESQLVAKYRRAGLVLEQEAALGDRGEAYENRHPKWLHVLMPVEQEAVDDLASGGESVSAELDAIRSSIDRLQARLYANSSSGGRM